MGNESHQLALAQGLWCITWYWSDVQANKEDFQLLMSSDNKDADTSMSDSEPHVIGDVIGKIKSSYMILGKTLEGTMTIYLITHASST